MRAEQGQFEQALAGKRPSAIHAHPPIATLVSLLACITLMLAGQVGCSRLRLPAIDPDGKCIFLPYPNTTQLALPKHSKDGKHHIFPEPAYSAPTMPPPCVDAGGAPQKLLKEHKLASKVKKHFESPGKAGEIQLTPTRVVAPVGGEVVLLAGICGENGYFVKRQPLEWMLSPDSVGTFIDVGDDTPGTLVRVLTLDSGPSVEKLDVDFARGRTSSKAAVVTRGSPGVEDDVPLKEGQTWLSISSPSEGVSRVTVLAPDSEIWDRRRQTATIYWVDAQWEFPPPQIARSGQTLQYTTRVTKAENLVPAENWIVQYTLLDPSVARFVPAAGSNVAIVNNKTANVRVNRDGQASIQIAAAVDSQGQPARGTSPIVVDVIRPADPSDNLPELKLGSGQTFATFSSPGLNLQTFGPDTGAVGEQLTYVASLGNPGDVDAENTQLVMNIPVGTRLVTAAPQPSTVTNSGLIWDQGVLPAHRQLDVSVVLEALRPGTFDVAFQAAGAGNLSAQSSSRTEIVEATVDLRFEPVGGAAQAEIGQRIEYAIDITNTSRQTLTDLRVVIDSDRGLPEEEQGTNQVTQTVSFIQPGQTYPLGIAFIVRQEGQLGAQVRVYSGENLLAERSTSVLGRPPRERLPKLGISIDFPQTIRVGQTYDALVTVRNSGEVKLTDLNVNFTWDASIRPTYVDSINVSRFRLGADGRSAVWSAQDLLPRLPGDSGDMIRSIKVAFECVSAAPQATLGVGVNAAEGVQAEDAVRYQAITNETSPPPPVTPPPAAQQRTGNWEISVSDFDDPTVVGNEIRYTVAVRNNQNLPDRNVRIELKLPPGVNFNGAAKLDGTPLRYEFGEQNTLTFEPIQFVRAGETINYLFRIVPNVPDVMRIQARVYSAEQPTPQQAEQTTTVNAR